MSAAERASWFTLATLAPGPIALSPPGTAMATT